MCWTWRRPSGLSSARGNGSRNGLKTNGRLEMLRVGTSTALELMDVDALLHALDSRNSRFNTVPPREVRPD